MLAKPYISPLVIQQSSEAAQQVIAFVMYSLPQNSINVNPQPFLEYTNLAKAVINSPAFEGEILKHTLIALLNHPVNVKYRLCDQISPYDYKIDLHKYFIIPQYRLDLKQWVQSITNMPFEASPQMEAKIRGVHRYIAHEILIADKIQPLFKSLWRQATVPNLPPAFNVTISKLEQCYLVAFEITPQVNRRNLPSPQSIKIMKCSPTLLDRKTKKRSATVPLAEQESKNNAAIPSKVAGRSQSVAKLNINEKLRKRLERQEENKALGLN